MSDSSEQPPRRILVFGGTFDPPHLAHARLPAMAAQQLGCEQILYVPAAINPLKNTHPTANKEQRLAMLLLAIADVPGAKISTIELDRPGPSYTIDTLRELKRQFTSQAAPRRAARSSAAARRSGKPLAQPLQLLQEPELHLLIGCDQALEFHRWKDWREILTLAAPAVMIRPPWTAQTFQRELESAYSPVEAEQWMKWTLRLPAMDINATSIREHLRRGDEERLSHSLDPAVLAYIRSQNLYRP